MNDEPAPGTLRWWGYGPYRIRGTVDSILRLLEQQEISRSKAREMLEWAECTRWGTVRLLAHGAQPSAPWEKLNWCDERTSETTKLSGHAILQALCRATCRWGLYLSWHLSHTPDDIMRAAPYLHLVGEDLDFWTNGGGIILFDAEDEMLELFDQTVGDDGPTRLNPYDGPVRVYALTCDTTGRLLSENT